jgi:hypothetical protein
MLAGILKKLLIGRAFTAENGKILMFDKMNWSLHSAKSMAIMIQDIGNKFGQEYLFKLGYEAGYDAGLEIIKCTGHTYGSGWAAQNAVIILTEFIGFGQLEFIKSDIEKDGHHHFILHVKDNPVINESVKLYKKKAMACKWFMGVYSAHGEVELGLKNARLKENKCVRSGSDYCEWESKW